MSPPFEPQRKSILIADDEAAHSEGIAWRLRREGYDVETAASGRECLDAIARRAFDAVLLDVNLGDASGIDVLASIRTSRAAAELPVIMVTAEIDSETTVRALKEGANDYITKPVNLDVAIARLRTHLDLRTATEELERRALYDPLTELPNRVLIADRLERAFARAARNGQWFALLVLDLDGFKDVNDRHGHVVGDLLLAAVARRLTEAARKADTVGRLGGDEFIIVAEDIHHPKEVHIIAARLEETVGRPYEIDGRRLLIGASVGSHVWRPGDPKDLDTLLKLADAAMYTVKRARKVS